MRVRVAKLDFGFDFLSHNVQQEQPPKRRYLCKMLVNACECHVFRAHELATRPRLRRDT